MPRYIFVSFTCIEDEGKSLSSSRYKANCLQRTRIRPSSYFSEATSARRSQSNTSGVEVKEPGT